MASFWPQVSVRHVEHLSEIQENVLAWGTTVQLTGRGDTARAPGHPGHLAQISQVREEKLVGMVICNSFQARTTPLR